MVRVVSPSSVQNGVDASVELTYTGDDDGSDTSGARLADTATDFAASYVAGTGT